MRAERYQHMALCNQHLGKHGEAAKLYWQGLLGDGLGWSSHLAHPLFRLYEEAGQTDDLSRMIDEFEKARVQEYEKREDLSKVPREEYLKWLPTHPLKELARQRALAARTDVKELIELASDSRSVNCNVFEEHFLSSDWRCKAAAEALAACGGKEVEQLREAIRERQGTSISWLIYALGRSSSPKALHALGQIAREEKGWNCPNVAYAISLKGQAGTKLLETIVREDDNGMRHAAQQRLEMMKKNPADQGPLPPQPGSLPKTLAKGLLTAEPE